MVLRDALLEASEPSIPASGFWMWDQWLRSRYSEDLTVLRLTQKDQASYSRYSVAFIRKLLAELGSDQWKQRRFSPTEHGPGSGLEEGDERITADRLSEDPAGDVFEAGGHLFLPDHHDAPMWKVEEKPAEAARPYTAFTTAHDRIVTAADLADQAALKEARAALELRRAEFRRDFARLVTRLQRRLLTRQIRHWSFDLDEGLIDASRLDRVILNPGFSSAYKKEQESEFRNSVVSILIDNSGSMRGKPIEIACLAADMLSAALERCGVACEILGFTTGAWKGGDSAKDWVRAGQPPDPGRLNDLLHIIYKSADEPVRRSRLKICAMLQTSLLRENIDGEALRWAYGRLITRPEIRKALIVISDGAPADQATLEHNSDKAILDRHLRRVIADIEKSGSIELTAIGVKHPVAQYYRNSVQIGRIENLGEALVATVDRLLAR
jgi:cobaltochelatase CobT